MIVLKRQLVPKELPTECEVLYGVGFQGFGSLWRETELGLILKERINVRSSFSTGLRQG